MASEGTHWEEYVRALAAGAICMGDMSGSYDRLRRKILGWSEHGDIREDWSRLGDDWSAAIRDWENRHADSVRRARSDPCVATHVERVLRDASHLVESLDVVPAEGPVIYGDSWDVPYEQATATALAAPTTSDFTTVE